MLFPFVRLTLLYKGTAMAVPQNTLPIRRMFERKGNTVRSSPEILNQQSVVLRNGHNRSLHCVSQRFRCYTRGRGGASLEILKGLLQNAILRKILILKIRNSGRNHGITVVPTTKLLVHFSERAILQQPHGFIFQTASRSGRWLCPAGRCRQSR